MCQRNRSSIRYRIRIWIRTIIGIINDRTFCQRLHSQLKVGQFKGWLLTRQHVTANNISELLPTRFLFICINCSLRHIKCGCQLDIIECIFIIAIPTIRITFNGTRSCCHTIDVHQLRTAIESTTADGLQRSRQNDTLQTRTTIETFLANTLQRSRQCDRCQYRTVSEQGLTQLCDTLRNYHIGQLLTAVEDSLTQLRHSCRQLHRRDSCPCKGILSNRLKSCWQSDVSQLFVVTEDCFWDCLQTSRQHGRSQRSTIEESTITNRRHC